MDAYGVRHNKHFTFPLFKDFFMKLLLPPFLVFSFVVCSMASSRARTRQSSSCTH